MASEGPQGAQDVRPVEVRLRAGVPRREARRQPGDRLAQRDGALGQGAPHVEVQVGVAEHQHRAGEGAGEGGSEAIVLEAAVTNDGAPLCGSTFEAFVSDVLMFPL